jgi:large subunit ribosomal protein L21
LGYEIRILSVCSEPSSPSLDITELEVIRVYAIVKAGGRQEKVTVGETITVDRIDAKTGASVTFPALLVVDGASVTTDPKVLSGVKVTGEILDEVKGPKIDILRYKNKTGHRRRQGFRAQHTRVKITAISGAK